MRAVSLIPRGFYTCCCWLGWHFWHPPNKRKRISNPVHTVSRKHVVQPGNRSKTLGTGVNLNLPQISFIMWGEWVNRQDDGGRVSKWNVKAPVLKIFWILKSLLTCHLAYLRWYWKFFLKKNIRFSFIWFHGICWFLFYLNCVFFPPLFYIKVYAVHASKLVFANKRCTFYNYFLSLCWFSVLYTYLKFVSYLLFYIRHRPIAWCIFIHFVNKSICSTLYFVVNWCRIYC